MKMMFLLAVLATVAFGFVGWWTFVIVAFAAAYFSQSFLIGALAPACAWLLTALVRDLIDHGRVSWRLAQLLHVRFGVATYIVLFLIVVVPSAFAARSALMLRSLRASRRAD